MKKRPTARSARRKRPGERSAVVANAVHGSGGAPGGRVVGSALRLLSAVPSRSSAGGVPVGVSGAGAGSGAAARPTAAALSDVDGVSERSAVPRRRPRLQNHLLVETVVAGAAGWSDPSAADPSAADPSAADPSAAEPSMCDTAVSPVREAAGPFLGEAGP